MKCCRASSRLEDEEISKELEKEFKKRGIKALVGHKVESVEATKTGVKVKVSAEGKETTLEADQALVAIGFRPNSKGLGLEEVGVKISERGFVEINEKMQTNVAGHLGHWRCDRQADAGARRLGDGHYLRREYCGRGNNHTGL